MSIQDKLNEKEEERKKNANNALFTGGRKKKDKNDKEEPTDSEESSKEAEKSNEETQAEDTTNNTQPPSKPKKTNPKNNKPQGKNENNQNHTPTSTSLFDGLLEDEKQTMEDTHKRKTFLIENTLFKDINNLFKRKSHGFQTKFINQVLRKAYDEYIELEKQNTKK
jgi:hypothetical protein